MKLSARMTLLNILVANETNSLRTLPERYKRTDVNLRDGWDVKTSIPGL